MGIVYSLSSWGTGTSTLLARYRNRSIETAQLIEELIDMAKKLNEQIKAGNPDGLTEFIFFNCFALNQYFQYRQVGKWKDYLYGERVYITLSFVAKSALAWQIFAGALAQSH